jgi:hypothetical protein
VILKIPLSKTTSTMASSRHDEPTNQIPTAVANHSHQSQHNSNPIPTLGSRFMSIFTNSSATTMSTTIASDDDGMEGVVIDPTIRKRQLPLMTTTGLPPAARPTGDEAATQGSENTLKDDRMKMDKLKLPPTTTTGPPRDKLPSPMTTTIGLVAAATQGHPNNFKEPESSDNDEKLKAPVMHRPVTAPVKHEVANKRLLVPALHHSYWDVCG